MVTSYEICSTDNPMHPVPTSSTPRSNASCNALGSQAETASAPEVHAGG